ncbi:MAG: hypothetical protein CM15mP77_3870 [Synechococcus sp.]|nr:MAG: hypothetical protein CM15mP77_3870 [Synechococcus sp.]
MPLMRPSRSCSRDLRTQLLGLDAGRRSPIGRPDHRSGIRSHISPAPSSLLEPSLHLGCITLVLVQHRQGDDGSNRFG